MSKKDKKSGAQINRGYGLGYSTQLQHQLLVCQEGGFLKSPDQQPDPRGTPSVGLEYYPSLKAT